MHREDDRAVGGSLVEIVDPQAAAILVVDLDVVRRERVVGKIGEAIVGCA